MRPRVLPVTSARWSSTRRVPGSRRCSNTACWSLRWISSLASMAAGAAAGVRAAGRRALVEVGIHKDGGRYPGSHVSPTHHRGRHRVSSRCVTDIPGVRAIQRSNSSSRRAASLRAPIRCAEPRSWRIQTGGACPRRGPIPHLPLYAPPPWEQSQSGLCTINSKIWHSYCLTPGGHHARLAAAGIPGPVPITHHRSLPMSFIKAVAALRPGGPGRFVQRRPGRRPEHQARASPSARPACPWA